MNLQRLRYFLVLAEELHFTRAAQRLFMDQSTLSAAIRHLERDLGVRLFERTSRRVALSAAGQALLPEAQRLLAAGERFAAVAGQVDRHAPRHGLVLGLYYGAVAAGELTGPIVHAFRAQHPDLALEVRTLTVEDPWGVHQPDLDVVLGRDAGLPGDAVTELFRLPKVIALPAHDELAAAPAPTLADVVERRWIDVGPWPEPAREFMAEYDLRATGIDVARQEVPLLPPDERWRLLAELGLLVLADRTTTPTPPPGIVLRTFPEVSPARFAVFDRREDSITRAFATVAEEVSGTLLPLVPGALPAGAP
ncbi:LysR substrate binding domain-containing protein [Kineococcus xinjiangensis]|uniref:LysR substrate binding domain-containing protein n=1 Tax=Kineococcus xinjiangensis TaxID=512762 RepID=A0A2S6IKM8_9ACTN|nr:LysR family transcriptional regulator [Kineococcus xinjiangensis]PPK94726.1 LysR substrate binding domain-containing protein [Kineococcus xinjiangensis]